MLRQRDEWAGGTMMVFEKLDFNLTINHILEATENFSDSYKLGRGGFGTVYRYSRKLQPAEYILFCSQAA